MNAPLRLGVVLINWNAGAETADCLRSLLPHLGARDRVVVIDNGSTDDSLVHLTGALDARSSIHVERENTGFAHAANRGARELIQSGVQCVLLLNNDARLAEGALDELLAASERHPGSGLYGPRIYADVGRTRFWCCGVALGGPNLCRLRGHGQADDGQRFRREEPVDSLTGAVLLIRREVFERIGYLDEGYFVYVEDAEFCARARRAGFAPRYVPTAVAVHAGGGASGGGYSALRKYLTAHGSARYLRQHGTLGLWLGYFAFELALAPVWLLRAALRGDGRAARWKLQGVIDGLCGRAVDRSLPARLARRTP